MQVRREGKVEGKEGPNGPGTAEAWSRSSSSGLEGRRCSVLSGEREMRRMGRSRSSGEGEEGEEGEGEEEEGEGWERSRERKRVSGSVAEREMSRIEWWRSRREGVAAGVEGAGEEGRRREKGMKRIVVDLGRGWG